MTVKTDFADTKESARRLRTEPTGSVTQTNVQKALEGMQPIDATLTALSNLSATPGFLTVVSQDVFTQRTFTATVGHINITNPQGVAGNPSLALANTGVTAATYGSATQTAIITVDAQGRITNAANTSISNLTNTVGLVVQVSPGVFTERILVAPAAGLTITNAAATGGDPTFALANALQSFEGVNTLGLVAFMASDTVTTRTVTAGGGITITNGAGTGGNPTVALTNISSSTFLANASGASAAPSETTRTQAINILAPGTPYCSVVRTSNQSTTTSLSTRIAFDTELFDSNGAFDNATNFRFTPQVAGKYYATVQAQVTATYTGGQSFNVSIFKNGASTNIIAQSSLPLFPNAGSIAPIQATAGFTALNGSTDFIEFYILSSGATPIINGAVTGQSNTFASVYYIGP